MIRLSQIKLALGEDLSAIPDKIAKELRISKKSDLMDYRIYKESIDARKGSVKKKYIQLMFQLKKMKVRSYLKKIEN